MGPPSTNGSASGASAIKIGDTVLIEGIVVAEWPADVDGIPGGYQVRFASRTGASYRVFSNDVVVALPTVRVPA